MARQRIDWNLSQLCSDGAISTKETKVEVPKEKGSKDKLSKVVTTVARVLNVAKFREAAENAVNKTRGKDNQVSLSYEYLLGAFVNDSIITNTKQALRIEANPEAAVKSAIENLRKKFPHVDDDKLKAMAAMLLDSMK